MITPILVLVVAILFGVLFGLFLFQCINITKTRADKECAKDEKAHVGALEQYEDALNSLDITISEVASETHVLARGLEEREEQLIRLYLQRKSSPGFFQPEDATKTNYTQSPFEKLGEEMRDSFSNYPEFNREESTLSYLVDFNLRYRAHHALVAELVAAYIKAIDDILNNSTLSTKESNSQFAV